MYEGNIAYWIFCGIGGINLFFLGLYLTSFFKKNPANLFVTILFISIGISLISKSFFNFLGLFHKTNLAIIKYSFWYLSYTIQGPCLYLFTIFLVRRKYFKRIDLIHFLPYLLNLIGYLILNDRISSYVFWGYTLLFFIYLVCIIIIVFNYSKDQIKSGSQEMEKALICLKRVILIYGLYKLVSLTLYLKFKISIDAFFLSCISYLFIYREFKNRGLSLSPYNNIKYKTSNINNTNNIDIYVETIITYIEKEELYLDRNLTLNKLADTVKIKPYMISNVINSFFGINFNELVNRYRIEKAKKLLSDKDYLNVKISYISYECGFNSISAFNKAFIKNVCSTPSQFRERMQNKR